MTFVGMVLAVTAGVALGGAVLGRVVVATTKEMAEIVSSMSEATAGAVGSAASEAARAVIASLVLPIPAEPIPANEQPVDDRYAFATDAEVGRGEVADPLDEWVEDPERLMQQWLRDPEAIQDTHTTET